MKKIIFMSIVALVLAGGAGGSVSGGEQASIDKGKALFSDPRLGTNGKTCNTCHRDGKGLEQAGNESDLEKIVNGCITTSLKGRALDPRSVEMQSMILYIKTFESKQPAEKKPPRGC